MGKWVILCAVVGTLFWLCACEASALRQSNRIPASTDSAKHEREATSHNSHRSTQHSATLDQFLDVFILSDVLNCTNITTCANDAVRAATDVRELDKVLQEAAKARQQTEHSWAYRLCAAVVSYFAITGPTTALGHINQLAMTVYPFDMRTVIIANQGDPAQLFSLVNGLQAAGVYQDVHILMDKGDESLWSAVQANLVAFEHVELTPLGNTASSKGQAMGGQAPLISQLWQAIDSVRTASPLKPLLLLSENVLPISFFAMRLGGIVSQLENMQVSKLYILDLTAQYWLTDDQDEITHGVSACPDINEIVGTEALFLPAVLVDKVAAWSETFEPGGNNELNHSELRTTAGLLKFLEMHHNCQVLGTRTALVQHVCTDVGEEGVCWQADAFRANSRRIFGVSHIPRREKLRIHLSSKHG